MPDLARFLPDRKRGVAVVASLAVAVGAVVGLTALSPSLGSTDRAEIAGQPTSTVAAGPQVPALAVAPQLLPVTIPGNPSQSLSILAPNRKDPTLIPRLTTSTPSLVVAGARYSDDLKRLLVSVMNVDPKTETAGQLTVEGWGPYRIKVKPNPSQLVHVDVPENYRTSRLPAVTSKGSLVLFSLSYTYPDGVPKLQLNIGNPSADEPTSGDILIDW